MQLVASFYPLTSEAWIDQNKSLLEELIYGRRAGMLKFWTPDFISRRIDRCYAIAAAARDPEKRVLHLQLARSYRALLSMLPERPLRSDLVRLRSFARVELARAGYRPAYCTAG
jgi:hypothetical protein